MPSIPSNQGHCGQIGLSTPSPYAIQQHEILRSASVCCGVLLGDHADLLCRWVRMALCRWLFRDDRLSCVKENVLPGKAAFIKSIPIFPLAV